MSYKLFDQGYTPEEIRKIKAQGDYRDHAAEEFKRWRESEHVLNILRSIKASEGKLDELALKVWREATGTRTWDHL